MSRIGNKNIEISGYTNKNTEKYKIFQTSNHELLEIFSKSLYPDHVIFLGPGVPLFKSLKSLKNKIAMLE